MNTASYSRWSYNFNGVYNIRFSMYVGGDGSKFTTYFETDSDQSYSGSTKSYSQGGNRSWREDDLNVSGLSGNHYIKFANIANAAGKHNPRSTLDWFRLDFTRYNFDLMDSCETFNRKLYREKAFGIMRNSGKAWRNMVQSEYES